MCENSSKKVSVIIPCFNAAKWLPQCFLSLAKQTIGIHNLELIFVNDASTDNGETWDLLVEMERAYPENVLIIDLAENRKQGGARNEGLKYATGEYIAFVDADDWVEPELYEKAYEKARTENAEIVQFNHYLYTDKIERVFDESAKSDRVIHISTVEERKACLMSGVFTYGCWNKLYKRELIEQANVKFAENVAYEEPLFVYPLYFYVSTMVIMHEAMYTYRFNKYGTTFSYLAKKSTLQEHAKVQMDVWKFMKKKDFFEIYYEEIKLYFLFTYLYETLCFAKLRGFDISLKQFQQLVDEIKNEVPDFDSSIYEESIPEIMELYKKIRRSDITAKEVQEIMDSIE